MSLLAKIKFYVIASILFNALITTTSAVKCPANCRCSWVLDSLHVDCSYSGLNEYPNFDDMPIEHLDLSHNNFIEFPAQLSDVESLLFLDLSNNQIANLGADDLQDFMQLHTLLLANNSFADWFSINTHAFEHAISLERLSLSGNALSFLSNKYVDNMLNSDSLLHLELQNCGITELDGVNLLNNLPKLERLSLSSNPIKTLTNLPSESLRELDLSNCSLALIEASLFEYLPNLETLVLSWNIGLQLGSKEKSISSPTLKQLDICFCSLVSIDLSGFSSLTKLRMQGNMLRDINSKMFANNTQLEMLNLARNGIRYIETDAFVKLKSLTSLDLAYNEIAQLDRNVFQANDALTTLNLSHNVMDKLMRLASSSLRQINFSWCEIVGIDSSAFSGLTALQSLDLSNNLLRDFPGGMRSETLQKLNLANCRLSHLRNSTFREFPELSSLRLSGNRFTNPISSQYFRSNKYLVDLWLGDNPWICDCHDAMFMDFYDFITAKPQKLMDMNHARCASPPFHYGKSIDSVCMKIWNPRANNSNAEKVWTTILICMLVIGVAAMIFHCFKRYRKSYRQSENAREYRENHEEMMQIRLENQRMLQQEGTPNAPNASDIAALPSYEDALQMPKPVRPVKSMLDLTASIRARSKKLTRSRTEPEDSTANVAESQVDLMLDYRQRFRSEEMLSNRDKERVAQINPQRRTGYNANIYNTSTQQLRMADTHFPAAHLKSQNLQSAEQIGNFQNYEHSPYTKRKPKIAEIPPFKRASLRAESVEFLTDPESKPGSPFARRKPKSPNTPSIIYGNLGPAVEDYFGTVHKSASSSSDGSKFHVVVEQDVLTAAANVRYSGGSSNGEDTNVERGRRRKRLNSGSRRASGNFTAAASAAAEDTSSSSEREPIVVVHRPMRETLF